VPAAPFAEVQIISPTSSTFDKENFHFFHGNDNIFEDNTSTKPVLIALDGDQSTEPLHTKKTSPSLGRPPKIPESRKQDAPKVRLCSELATHAAVPGGIIALVFCILAASHSGEDLSFDAIHRSVDGSIQDLYEDESWLTWALLLCVLLIVVAGLICMYQLSHNAATSAATPASAHARVVPKEDRPRVLTSRRTRRSELAGYMA
jgi:hypothetical protein